jgi:hypothetical protein
MTAKKTEGIRKRKSRDKAKPITRDDPGFKPPRAQENDVVSVYRKKVDPISYFCGACESYLAYGSCDCESMWGHRLGCASNERHCNNPECKQYRIVV